MLPTEKPALIARLHASLASKKMSKADLARACMTTPQSVNGWLETGRIAKERLPVLASALGVTIHWLLTGEVTTPNVEQKSCDEFLTITQIDTGGSMGRGVDLPDQPGSIAQWKVTTEWANKNLPSHTGSANLKIVTGFGDSMRGMFEPGDPLIVDAGVRECSHDGVYFFRVGTEGFIKRLQRKPTPDGLVYRAISQNRDYETFDITSEMDFEVLAKVIKVWHSTTF